jgi:hypothetical protein
MHNDVRKTIQFEKLQCWYCRNEEIMKYAIEIASGNMIDIQTFMTVAIGI